MRLSSRYIDKCWFDCGQPIAAYVGLPGARETIVVSVCAKHSAVRGLLVVATTLEEAELYVMKGNL